MKDSLYHQFSTFIEDWVPEEASIAIADENKYVTYIPGKHDININQGQPIPSGSITERVYLQKSRVESLVDKSVFGLPYYGVGYPLENKEAGLSGALTVILPPDYYSSPVSFIVGRQEDVWIPIAVHQIIYIESHQKKTLIVTEEGCFQSKYPLKTLEFRLSNSFIRIHRSYIVNISYIKQISRDVASNLEIALRKPEDTRLSISQSYVQKVRDTLGF
ncbi:LytTR family transcriptional regulator DNA-binding domain-containing protein [Salipaludibacillus sp. CUR1]|uniref:LytR/AlgR family response regulator transcription factor n=1 Tax=Salipaludibacillus sp. CUR1 TaxID=2820003 RepID=UPI001E5E44AA|nr:LytTR family DNA-binding domain-containing protein [Salipaludibacillus sp. CUR1]MCE7792185.1 LytTR family transcriptional regulator DNA-binding domain-containing protein [Salipaludibacillus sp. CUR1]